MSPAVTYVPPSGRRDSPVIFVGEQPGHTEIRKRVPFVGPSGQLLHNILRVLKVPTTACYFTNVIKDLDKTLEHYYIAPKPRSAPGWTEAGGAYVRELVDELAAMPGRLIYTAGNVPLLALTQRSGITKWRGSILPCVPLPDKWVVPILHPSFILRGNLEMKHLLLLDIKKGLEFHERGYQLTAREAIIKPSYAQVMAFLDECLEAGLNGQPVAYDIEIGGLEVTCISFSVSPTRAMSIPLHYMGGPYFAMEQEIEIWKRIAVILESRAIRKLGQNLVFDSHFLLRKLGIRVRNIDDTMVAQQIIMTEFKKGLDFVTSIWTDIPYYKDDGKEWFKGRGSYENFWTYNAMDSMACSTAFPAQTAELVAQKNIPTYERQRLVIEPCVYMMERGIRCDVEGMKLMAAQLERDTLELRERLRAKAGFDLNPQSPKQLCEYFYRKLKFKPYVSAKTKKESVDQIALVRIARQGCEEARMILDIRKKEKLIANYANIDKVDPDGRIRCSYNPVGTAFSRLSSSSNIFGTGMNLQNWPHEMLRYLHPDEGYIYYSFDLSQAENRIVAYVGRIESMINAFETGKDVHCLTAGLIFNKPPEEISKEPGSCSIGGGAYSERDWGKKANHGLNYDFGYKQFAIKYEIPETDAKRIYDGYHSAYPGVKHGFHAYIRDCLNKTRYIENLMGRRTLFLGELEDRTYKQGYACIPQGTVGDVMNERGLEYVYYNREQFGLVELLIQIHDSMGMQIPVSLPWTEHARMLDAMKRKLETPLFTQYGREFVVPADLSIGLSLSKMEVVEVKASKWPGTIEELAVKLEQSYAKLLEERDARSRAKAAELA